MTHKDDKWENSGYSNYSAPQKTSAQIKKELFADITKQIKKINEDGRDYNEDTKEWEWVDETSRYPQKHAVLVAVSEYLLGTKDLNELSRVVYDNPKYDKGGIGRSATGKLLDRALKFKGEELIENPTLRRRF